MSSVATNTFLIFLGYFASFCYVAWLVRGCLASAAQVGKADGDHFEQFSDMMKVGLSGNGVRAACFSVSTVYLNCQCCSSVES